MKRFWIAASLLGLLVAGGATQPVSADEEVKGGVPARSDANNPDTEVYRASDIMNMPVKDDSGAEVGRIKDLVINGGSREVLYAVVSLNDAKEKDAFYVMPWSVFQPNYGPRNVLQYTVLTLAPNVWNQAPYYSAAQWRQAAYSDWGPRVNNYYANHIRQGAAGNNRSTNVKAAKPAINDEDVNKSTSPKSTEKKDEKSDDKANRDKEAPNPKVAPKAEPKVPNKVEAPAPSAPKAPGLKEVEPTAPKNPIPAPSPREPKTPAPK